MTHKFDPHFTEEQNHAYALMLLREGFEQLTGENRTKALSLIDWHEKNGDFTDKQWWLATKLAAYISADKLDLNFATDKDVKPQLQAIVEKADALIQAEHDAEAATYGMGPKALTDDLALVEKLKAKVMKHTPQVGSWVDNEIAAIIGEAAPKKSFAWLGQHMKPGKAKADTWQSLGRSLNLSAIKPAAPGLLQSTAMTIAEAKALLTYVAHADANIAGANKAKIEAAGGINSVLIKAGLDPKLPPNDVFVSADVSGDLIHYFGKSHMFMLAMDDLNVLPNDHQAAIVTDVPKTAVMTIAEADEQAMEHYPPYGVSPWQAKQALLMLASPEPVLSKIGFNLMDKLGDFQAVLEAAHIAPVNTKPFNGWKTVKATYSATAGGITYQVGDQGYFIPLKDLKSKNWGKTAGDQLLYSETTHYAGKVEPSAEFPHALLELGAKTAKSTLKSLSSTDTTEKLAAFHTVNMAGGINKVLSSAGLDQVLPAHEELHVEKDYATHKLMLAVTAGGAGHAINVAMDHLHDIKPVFFTGKPKLEAKEAWDHTHEPKLIALDLKGLQGKNLLGNKDAYEVHVVTDKNPASVIAVLYEKLFKKWDVVAEAIGPHKVTVTFPKGSIHYDNLVELKAMLHVAEEYLNAPLDKIMDEWKDLDAKPQVHVTPTMGSLTGKSSVKAPALAQKPQASKTVNVTVSKPKGLILPKKKQGQN